ncbi:MAG TPA: DUF4082 domain-containing protein [Bacillota bacterium]|nr:DUF4082 domain-containing protein [Bacillota bacterium]
MHARALPLIALVSVLSVELPATDLSLLTSPGNGSFSASQNPSTVGLSFKVGSSPLVVKSLGLLDWGAPGFLQEHSIGLWTQSGALLARVDFSPGLQGYTDNLFRYQDLTTPIRLQSGTTYVLGASYLDFVSDRCLVNGNATAETYSPSVTFISTRYSNPIAGLVFPAYSAEGSMSYGSANLMFDVVPEPGFLPLWLLGLVIAGVVRKCCPSLRRTGHPSNASV